MEIIIGNSAGFCYGVRRAVEGVENELCKMNYKKVYCLGELVHNQDVIKNLEEKGLIVVQDIKEIQEKEDSICIIRAHGEKKETYEIAKKNSIKLVDYTCPNVLKNHKLIEEYTNNKYYAILFGNKNHPENIGTLSYGNYNRICVETEDELEDAIYDIKAKKIKKVFAFAQTTFSMEKFKIFSKIIEQELKSENTEVKILNTICNATEIRQMETKELSNRVDVMIILGGKNSSNTKKLYDIAKENCENHILVENLKEIDFKKLEEKGFKTVGIMAGASTPHSAFKIDK